MTTKEHFAGNSSWKFFKPTLRVETEISIESIKNNTKSSYNLVTSNICRETIINNLRSCLRARLTDYLKAEEKTRVNGWVGWKETSVKVTGTANFERSPSPATLSVLWHPAAMCYFPEGGSEFPVEKFIKVCDALLGPISVLLSPNRAKGDWWKTDWEKATGTFSASSMKFVSWSGSDNWLFSHPATVSLATGLYRQCLHLCGAGLADKILETVSVEEVEEALSDCRQVRCLQIVNKLREFIEVPPADGTSNRVNYPITIGTWGRLIKLQRAIRRLGYEKALGQSFTEGWALNPRATAPEFDGLYQFWGVPGEETKSHFHMMEAGKVRKK